MPKEKEAHKCLIERSIKAPLVVFFFYCVVAHLIDRVLVGPSVTQSFALSLESEGNFDEG